MSPTYEPSGIALPSLGEAPSQEWSVPQPGQIVAGKYRVEGVIGQGGLAIILRAFHMQLEEPVALKLLAPAWAKSTEVMQRFLDEGRLATKIRSEHVVRVYDVGALDDGAPYIVMECLEGSDLDALVASQGALPVDTAISYVLQAGEAIAEAHAHSIVHRDLKPANLFLTHRPDGSPCVKVLDFGISKRTTDPRGPQSSRMTAPNAVMGSPHYMSPEQILTPHEVDTRCDVWALGAILYELIAGRPPFDLPTLPELYHAIVDATPEPLASLRADVSPVMDSIVARCMAKNPADRYQTVGELAVALAALDPELAGASAERIMRVLGGGIHVDTVRPVAMGRASQPSHGGGLSIHTGRDLVMPRARRRKTGAALVVAALALLGAGGFVSHKYFDVHVPFAAIALDALDMSEPAPAAAASPAPPAAPVAIDGVAHPAAERAPAPAEPAPAVLPAPATPAADLVAPARVAPPPAVAAPAPARVAPPARARRSSPARVAPSTGLPSPSSFAVPFASAPPASPAPAPRGSSPDPDGLFEERK